MIKIKKTNCFRMASNMLMVNETVFVRVNGIWMPASMNAPFGMKEVMAIFDFLEQEKEYFEIYAENVWAKILEGKMNFLKEK